MAAVTSAGGARARVDAEVLGSWVDHGLISAAQASEIMAFESDLPPARGFGRDLLGYLGAVLVLCAGFILVAEMWPDMQRGARVLVSAVAGSILLGAGAYLSRSPVPTSRRLGNAAMMLGTAPCGLAAGVAADALVSSDVAVLIGFLVALGLSLASYVRIRSWAQLTALLVSSFGTALALGDAVTDGAAAWLSGVLAVVVGVAWLAAAARRVVGPRALAEVGGVGAMAIGSLIVVAELGPDTAGGRVAMGVWIASAVGVVARGVASNRVVLIIGGVLGLLLYLPWLITEVLGEGVGAPVALLVAGGLLIGAAIHLTRRSDQ